MEEVILEWVGSTLLLIVLALVLPWGWSTITRSRERRWDDAWSSPASLGLRRVVPPGGMRKGRTGRVGVLEQAAKAAAALSFTGSGLMAIWLLVLWLTQNLPIAKVPI